MNQFIMANICGKLYREIVYSQNESGRGYAKFTLSVFNPRVKNASSSVTYVEVTVWDTSMIKFLMNLEAKQGHTLYVTGQLFSDFYKGRTYLKMYARDVQNLEAESEKVEIDPRTEQQPNMVDPYGYEEKNETFVTDDDYKFI